MHKLPGLLHLPKQRRCEGVTTLNNISVIRLAPRVRVAFHTLWFQSAPEGVQLCVPKKSDDSNAIGGMAAILPRLVFLSDSRGTLSQITEPGTFHFPGVFGFSLQGPFELNHCSI